MPKQTESEDNGAVVANGHDPEAVTHRVNVPGTSVSTPMAPPPDREAEARKEAGVGIGLADDLRHIRTALAKAYLAADFAAAFDLMLFQMGRSVFTFGYKADALDITVRETADRPTIRMNDAEFETWSPGEAMLADRSGLSMDWLEIEDDGESFAALRALPVSDKQAQFAACVACAHGQAPARLQTQAHPELEATVARLDIDFAKHVRPTAAMLWSRIAKARIRVPIRPGPSARRGGETGWSAPAVRSRAGRYRDSHAALMRATAVARHRCRSVRAGARCRCPALGVDSPGSKRINAAP